MPIVPGPNAPNIFATQLATLRAMVNDPAGDEQAFSDDEYATALDNFGADLNATAAYFWGLKASQYSDLVNVNESGSSRNLGDLYKNALELQKYYAGQVAGAVTATGGKRKTRIGQIVRTKVDST